MTVSHYLSTISSVTLSQAHPATPLRLTGTAMLSPSVTSWLSQLRKVIDIERVLMCACCVHTLISPRHILEYTHPCTNVDTHIHALTSAEASWPLAWQESSRWKFLVRSISNSEQMIRPVLKLQSSWRHQMQTIFWQRKSFWCLSLRHKKSEALSWKEYNCGYHCVTDAGSYRGPDEAQNLSYTTVITAHVIQPCI